MAIAHAYDSNAPGSESFLASLVTRMNAMTPKTIEPSQQMASIIGHTTQNVLFPGRLPPIDMRPWKNMYGSKK